MQTKEKGNSGLVWNVWGAHRIAGGTLLALMPFLTGGLAAQEWRYYGGDVGGARFSPLKQINRENVNQLKWMPMLPGSIGLQSSSIEGEISPMAPASILRTHPNTTIYLDTESASLLSQAANRSL
jgi:glucose dehydrogenase